MMKKLFLLLASILSCAVTLSAQTTLTGTPVRDNTTTTKERGTGEEPGGAGAPSTAKESGENSGPPAPAVPPVEKTRPVKIPYFDKPVVIDGRLDDAIWKQAIVLKDFLQTQPGDNISPSRPTEVLLGYDEKHFYVAFHAYDQPGSVRTTVPKRDAIFDDDQVGLYLDTFNDKRRAYVLLFNPFGVQADGILTEGRGEDYSFDMVMQSKGALSDDGYIVEVAIPFKSLRYEARDGILWGAHFIRRIKRFNDEQNSWMPLSRDRSGLLNQAGHLTGFEKIGRSRSIEIIPSFTIAETGRRVRTIPRSLAQADPTLLDSGRLLNEPANMDPGLTAKIGITPNVTLDLAVNPDFAQVEADQLVVTANQRFPIFFEEKRPFFLEGIDIFQTRLNVLHTRAIIDPDVAAKLSGKSGRNTFGVLFASDNAPGNFNDEERLEARNQPFLDKNSYIGVLRLKRDIGKESSLGLIATTSNFVQRHNQLGGFDGRFRLNPTTVFDFQVVGTSSHRNFFDPQLGRNVYRTGNALGYAYQYDKLQRNWNINLRGEGRTRFYRADVGFTQRTNTNLQRYFVRYNSNPNPKGRIVSWFVSNATPMNFDWQGRMQNWSDELRIGAVLPRQTSFSVGVNGGYERLFESEFGPQRTATRRGTFAGDDNERSTYKKGVFFTVASTPSKKYSGSIFVFKSVGDLDLDFGNGRRFPRVSPAALTDPDAPLDPGPGHAFQVRATLVHQPTNALRTSFDYTKSRLTRYDTGLTAFDVNIYSMRTTYQFTPYTFMRARVDYTNVPGRLSGQFLLGWTPNPGTSFYVGYNDNLSHNELNPYTGQYEPGFQRNTRTFFIKVSYLLRRAF